MRNKLSLLALATALAGCQHADVPERGLSSVNVPVVSRADYFFDVAAPYGALPPAESARLDAWFRGLGLGYGDVISIDGDHSNAARADVARVAGTYGMLVSNGRPVTAGQIPSGSVRIVVSRHRVAVPNCPNWSGASSPNYDNRSTSNFGCAVNTNLAAMIANPQDLVHGRDDTGVSDAIAATKAIDMYRNWPLTGIIDGQQKRPLQDANTKKDEN